MANLEQLDILTQGVSAWNEWRSEHSEILPDLSYADLRKHHLEEVNFSVTNLVGSNLKAAHLEGADLSRAHLERANLQRAFFNNATRLNGAVFGKKKQDGVSFADVRWEGTNLAVVDWEYLQTLGDEQKARKIRPAQQFRFRAAARANNQLAIAMRAQGLNDEADHFAYRAQLLQRTVWWQQHKWLKYIFSWFLCLLAGYGYRPLRSLLWYLAITFGFATTYAASGHLPFFPDALVFSFTSFHGRGFFPGLGNETSLHNPLVVLAAFEAVTGLFIEISFIATFTKRFFGS